MKRRHIIGIIVILAFVLISGVALVSNLTPYVSFSQAKVKNSAVQVRGSLESEIQTLNDGQGVSFCLKDDDGVTAQVIYKGIKPENMEHSEGVVVVGKFDGDIFRADKILVKCPSKYESQTGGGSQ